MRIPTRWRQLVRSGALALWAWPMSAMAATLLVLARLCSATGSPRERERGDVPGWVLVTLMTAGLVTTIWAIAGDQLAQVFTTAISGVTGPGRK